MRIIEMQEVILFDRPIPQYITDVVIALYEVKQGGYPKYRTRAVKLVKEYFHLELRVAVKVADTIAGYKRGTDGDMGD